MKASAVFTWWHEIIVVALTIWTAIGTQGQNNLIDLASNFVHNHTGLTSILIVASIIAARLKQPPVLVVPNPAVSPIVAPIVVRPDGNPVSSVQPPAGPSRVILKVT